MSAETIECDQCGQAATVHSAQHEYDTLMYQGSGGFSYQLRRSHYEIDCPHCGRREQTVEFADE